MALVKKAMTGMKDILPEEMQIREYVLEVIKKTYKSFGFIQIETPIIEHIENLSSKQGGDNEKLIFKILKRGEKLKLDNINEENDLVDSGLRYDLTLPLARYYASNMANLPSPFKAIQIGNVFRAERPQKGRFRQFVQCDIDILGEESNIAEIELINATTLALSKIFKDRRYIVRINDRKILKAMADYANFDEKDIDKVFIILDKMDKIGLEGVRLELENALFDRINIDKYLSLFSENINLSKLKDILKDYILEKDLDKFEEIIDIVKAANIPNCTIVFDPTLVRGMGYYTGTIFEISMDGFSGSIAGGGRYDKMIGKFVGKDTPACGFSIGFERIIGILFDNSYKFNLNLNKKVYLYEKDIDKDKLSEIMKKAELDRENGHIVYLAKMNKNKKFQKQQLETMGYKEFIEFYK